jgi:hypothetical protein
MAAEASVAPVYKKMFAEQPRRALDFSFGIPLVRTTAATSSSHDAQALNEAKVPLSTEGDGVEGQSPNCHRMRTLLRSRADVMVRRLQ